MATWKKIAFEESAVQLTSLGIGNSNPNTYALCVQAGTYEHVSSKPIQITNWWPDGALAEAIVFNTIAYETSYFNKIKTCCSGGASGSILTVELSTGAATTYEALRLTGDGKIGICGAVAPSYDLSLGGDAAKTIKMEAGTVATTPGYELKVQAGACTAGYADLAGGTLTLRGGSCTGQGMSGVQLYGAGSTTDGSGTTGRNATQLIVEVLGNKLGFFGVTPVTRPSVPDGSLIGTVIDALQALGLVSA